MVAWREIWRLEAAWQNGGVCPVVGVPFPACWRIQFEVSEKIVEYIL